MTRNSSLLSAPGWVIVRAASYPYERRREQVGTALEEPWFREALSVTSANLAERCRDGKDLDDLGPTFQKYLARMATRPTPFGLFAAVGIGSIDRVSALQIGGPEAFLRRASLDIATAFELVKSHRVSAAVVATQRYRLNPNRVALASTLRVFLKFSEGSRGRFSNIELDAVVEGVIGFVGTRDVFISEVRDWLGSTFDADVGESEEYVHDLIANELLIPSATPASLTTGVASDLRNRLGHIPELATVLDEVSAALSGLSGVSMLDDRVQELDVLRSVTRPLLGSSGTNAFRVDLELDASAVTLSRKQVDELRDAAFVLLAHRSTARREPSRMPSVFAERFAERHEDRFVPVAEALDLVLELTAESTLAFNARAMTTLDWSGAAPSLAPRMLRAYAEAVARGQDIDISDWPLPEGSVIADIESLGVLFQLAPAAALGREGQEHVIVGPMLTAGGSAAAFSGRFSAFSSPIADALRSLAEREQANTDALLCDVSVLLPGDLGATHVHASIRAHYIELDPAGVGTPGSALSLDDLEIGVAGDRVIFRRKSDRRPIRIRVGSYVDPDHGEIPPIARLLWLSGFERELGGSFQWRDLAYAPFLPRVWYRNVLLSAACWNVGTDQLGRDPENWPAALERHAASLSMPRNVLLVEDDNVLPIDMSIPSERERIMAALRKRTASAKHHENVIVTLREELPTNVITSPRGTHAAEFFVPFLWTGDRSPVAPATQVSPHAERADVPRTFAPGSEVVYIKAYCSVYDVQKVTSRLAREATALVEEGLVDRWFFLRYHDPEHHLRFRAFAVDREKAAVVQRRLLDALNHSQDGAVWKIRLDAYERELERYGGPNGIEVAERFFFADAVAAERATRSIGHDAPERMLVVGIAALHHLRAFSFDTEAAIRFLRGRVALYIEEMGKSVTRGIQSELRVRGEAWRDALLGKSSAFDLGEAEQAYGEGLDGLARLAREFEEAHARSEVGISVDTLLSSLLHMHATRVFSIALRYQEAVALGVLGRTVESLWRTGAMDDRLCLTTTTTSVDR